MIGKGKTLATYHKYSAAGKHFENFLKLKYGRMDIMPSELTHVIIHDFDIYLRTVVSLKPNSATKTLKFFKTVVIFAQKCGVLTHDPFAQHRFHLESVDRGFLTDDEITRIMEKEFSTPRLESVRDIFIFSCFCGLAYLREFGIRNVRKVPVALSFRCVQAMPPACCRRSNMPSMRNRCS